MYPVFHALDRRAPVDVRRRDEAAYLEDYPRLARSRGVDVLVKPGELLFLPRGGLGDGPEKLRLALVRDL